MCIINIILWTQYYRHTKSNQVLRSIEEIVYFLMYEICPGSQEGKSDWSWKREENHQDGDERSIWGNDCEDFVKIYKKLEDEAAENLVSLTHDNKSVANLTKEKPLPLVDNIASSSASSVDDDCGIDLINHIPICASLEELRDFLVSNRNFKNE